MISLPPRSKVYIFHDSVSFHKQIDGLAAMVRQYMGMDPLSGNYFVFRSRSRCSARILHFDGSGYCLLTKRLSSGVIKNWPHMVSASYSKVLVREVYDLLWGAHYDDITKK
jgi:transposase